MGNGDVKKMEIDSRDFQGFAANTVLRYDQRAANQEAIENKKKRDKELKRKKE